MDHQDVLIGVVSRTRRCARSPDVGPFIPVGPEGQETHAVYTRVTPYYEWILNQTNGTSHCVPHKIFTHDHTLKLISATVIG